MLIHPKIFMFNCISLKLKPPRITAFSPCEWWINLNIQHCKFCSERTQAYLKLNYLKNVLVLFRIVIQFPSDNSRRQSSTRFRFDSLRYHPTSAFMFSSNADRLDVYNLLHLCEKCFRNAEYPARNKTLESCYSLRQLNPLLYFQLVTISNHIVRVGSASVVYLRLVSMERYILQLCSVRSCSFSERLGILKDLILKYLLLNL